MAISSLTIKNFRGFMDFKVSGFENFNLITGLNSVGKSTFLEAIFLSCCKPSESAFHHLERGSDQTHVADCLRHHQPFPVWEHWTNDNAPGRSVEISAEPTTRGRAPKPRRLVLTPIQGLDDPDLKDSLRARLNMVGIGGNPAARYMLMEAPCPRGGENHQHEYLAIEIGGRYQVIADRAPDDMTALGPIELQRLEHVLSSSHLTNAVSDLDRQSKRLVVSALKEVDPRIEDLEVNTRDGRAYISLWIDNSKRPLSECGDGLVFLFSQLIRCSQAADGLLLIDEIDTGLHWKRMGSAVQSLVRASKRFNTQVFATTHSFDFLRSAGSAVSDLASSFRLIELIRTNDGDVGALTADWSTFLDRLEAGVDQRG
jgi:AAA ATPase domain/AAA domain, putative AbiEii toxin, Type IV TA system